MLKIYELIGDISCVEIIATITPTRRIEKIDGWIGAHIRNMLLAATNDVDCNKYGSLMDLINKFPLEDIKHPWYKELKGGFPKGYSIKILSQTKRGYEQTIEQGEAIQFSISLIGSLSKYVHDMITAIEIFSERGIHGKMNLEINAVKQYSLLELLYEKHSNNRLLVDFITPVSLFNGKHSSQMSNPLYLRMNGFIPLFQLVVAAANRMAKMAVLYCNCKATVAELSEATQEITAIAGEVMLKRCNLSHTVLTTAKRKATNDTMVFDGLVGQSEWNGEEISSLYPLLRFCSFISIGDNVVYGMGNMNVSYIE